MHIEEKVNNKKQEIKDILVKWRISPNSEIGAKKLGDIYSWFRNFKVSEFEDAFLILSKIIRYSKDHLKKNLVV